MKMSRAKIVLLMLFLLQEKGGFAEKQIREQCGIARSTFFLALSDFRCFLQEHRPFLELVYDKKKAEYRLMDLNPLMKGDSPF